MDLRELCTIADKVQALRTALDEKPEMLTFLKLLREQDCAGVVQPVMLDPLVTVSVAAKTLCVDRGTIYQYVKEGLLHPWKTPHSNRMKFRVSEINAIPKRGESTSCDGQNTKTAG